MVSEDNTHTHNPPMPKKMRAKYTANGIKFIRIYNNKMKNKSNHVVTLLLSLVIATVI